MPVSGFFTGEAIDSACDQFHAVKLFEALLQLEHHRQLVTGFCIQRKVAAEGDAFGIEILVELKRNAGFIANPCDNAPDYR